VATYAKWGGTHNNRLTANSLDNLFSEKIDNRLRFHRSMAMSLACIFWRTVYMSRVEQNAFTGSTLQPSQRSVGGGTC